MTEEKKKTEKTKRRNNADFILSPLTNRYVRRGGGKWRELVTDGMLDLDPKDRKNNILGKGTDEELKVLKKHLEKTNLISKNKKLRIFKGKLQMDRKRLTKEEMLLGTQKRTKEAIMANKRIISETRLNDEQMMKIIDRIIDLKAVGKSVNIEEEIKALLDREEKLNLKTLTDALPKESPKLERTKLVRARRAKFKVHEPTPILTETEIESEFPESDSSD